MNARLSSQSLTQEPHEGAQVQARRVAWGSAAAAVVVSVIVYRTTWLGMIGAWSGSTTFGHGWAVIPIVAFLLWRGRERVARAPAQRSAIGLISVAMTVALWWLGEATQFSTISQLAAVATPAAVVLALAGPAALRACAFPLGYLFFAVPIGEELVPALMEFTADFATLGLQLAGIPVYREGLFLSIPGGDFEVAKACSGVRYLIASVALATLYAFLMYRSSRRRLAFIALAVIIPIIANGLRAMLIIVLAHLSDMRLAAGVDHLVYGWLFFGIVMGLTFWIGGRWRETRALPEARARSDGAAAIAPYGARSQAFAAGLVIAMLCGAGAAAARFENAVPSPADAAIAVALPAGIAGWSGPAFGARSDWQPQFHGAGHTSMAGYRRGADTVQVFAAVYWAQSQGRELINSENRLYQPLQWRLVRAGEAQLATDSASAIGVRTLVLQRGVRRRMIAFWYVVDGTPLRSALAVKIAHLKRLFTDRSLRPTIIAVATDGIGETERGVALLSGFLQDFAAPATRCAAQPIAASCRMDRAGRGVP